MHQDGVRQRVPTLIVVASGNDSSDAQRNDGSHSIVQSLVGTV